MDPDAGGIASPELLEQLGDAVTVIGPEWRYRYVSDGAARLIGRPATELVGLHVWDDVFPDVVGTSQHAQAVRAMTERTSETIVWFFQPAARWYSQLALPVEDVLVVVVTDVTETMQSLSRSELLLRAGEELAKANTYDDVATAVHEHVLAHMGDGIAGGVLLVDEQRGLVRSIGLQAPADSRERWLEYPLALRTPGTDAWHHRRAVHVHDLDDLAARYPAILEDFTASTRHATSAYPLVSADTAVGVLVLAYPRDYAVAAGEDQFLSTAAAMTAQALLRIKLLDVERRSVQALQRSLLPGSLPDFDGLEIAVRYVASDATAEVGGDWYDVVQLPGGGVGLVMGDVEGHDLGAAAIMGLVRGAVRAYALDGHPPALVLERANTFLAGLDLGRLVTVSFAQIHPPTGLATSVSAGHPPTLVAEPGRSVRQLPTEVGPPLGVVPGGHVWPETTSQVEDDAVLAMFTDGLVEQRGHDIDAGICAAAQRLETLHGEPASAIADSLLGLRPAESHDDVALVVVRVRQSAESTRRVRRLLPARPASVHLARRFTRQVLTSWSIPPEVLDSAELTVSELVTNAARHSEDGLEVTLEHDPRLLRVVVFDTSHRLPAAAGPVAEDATSGRGLMLVESVADRWGVDSTGLSKRVWAEFDLPTR